MTHPDSFGARSTLSVGGTSHEIFRLDALQSRYDVARLPYTLRVLLENVLRREDGLTVTADDVEAVATWDAQADPSREITFAPARVLLQDFTGVPAIVDLAAMRDAMAGFGGDPSRIDPLIPAELVIDHSVQVDDFASRLAIRRNAELEFRRNRERYAFLRWGQGAFDSLEVVPPNTGICHQVNLEFLARVVESRDGQRVPRHARRDGLAHDDGQRPRRARLGRRRDRGRGGDARRGDLDARPAGRRLPPARPAARGRDGDRPRAHRDADPPRDRGRREVRRVLRRGARRAPAGRPRDDREHVAGVRRDVRLLPRRRRDAALPPPDRPRRRPASRSSRRTARRTSSGTTRASRRRTRRSSSSTSRPSSRRSPGRGGRRTASRSRRRRPRSSRRCRASASTTGAASTRRSPSRSPRATRPAHADPGAAEPHAEQAVQAAPVAVAPTRTGIECELDGRARAPRPRRGRDRRDHVVHEHVEPVGDGRRGAAREEGRRARPRPAPVGEVEPRAGLEGRQRLLRPCRPDPVPRGARLPHRRLRLHDVHRELRAAARAGLARRSPRATSSRAPCSPGTGTSRRASTPR